MLLTHYERIVIKTAHSAYVNSDCDSLYKMLLRVSKAGGNVLGWFRPGVHPASCDAGGELAEVVMSVCSNKPNLMH